MLAAVFQAVLTVREHVDEIVAAVIAPGCRPLASAASVVVGVLATATIAAFEIACRVDDETGAANAVTHGLCRHAHHFADGRQSGRRKFDVGQPHLRDEPLRVDQSKPPLRIVGRGEVRPWRPLRRGAAAAARDMAVAADDAVDLIRRHACLVHRLLAGQDGVGTERLVHRDAVPATIDRRMSDTGHCDLAAVLPYAEPVLVSPPLIPVWRAHGSSFPLCSGCEGMAGTNQYLGTESLTGCRSIFHCRPKRQSPGFGQKDRPASE